MGLGKGNGYGDGFSGVAVYGQLMGEVYRGGGVEVEGVEG